jgi:hypothetical protein
MNSLTPSLTSLRRMWLRISPLRTISCSHRVASVSLAYRRFFRYFKDNFVLSQFSMEIAGS